MKIFLDTANLDEIRRGLDMGMVDGVTTNPSLVSRENREFLPLVKEICALVPGPVSVEVTALDSDAMVEEARRYADMAENVVIKVPINSEGLKVIRRLYELGIRTNTTLVFSPSQALLAAKAGTAFVSPFVGRIDDISGSGMELVEQIVQIFGNYDIQTEVIVASIRHPLHFVQSALIGADIATVPFSTLDRLLNHPLTDQGMARFLEDWKKVKK
ncbi:MAG TPA: fructose-6-phosphate aldolase [Candidatus Aminicenantes bacterium]|nr:fructose-6-phosphate aldolase [Candidatus Aminicenantes bacterium]